MPPPSPWSSFANTAFTATLNVASTGLRRTITSVTTNLTSYLAPSIRPPNSKTDNGILLPPGLVQLTRALYLFHRASYHEDGQALYDFIVIHFDTDLFAHAEAEGRFLSKERTAREDYLEAKECLEVARGEIDGQPGGDEGGDDALMRWAFGELMREVEGRERGRETLVGEVEEVDEMIENEEKEKEKVRERTSPQQR